MFNSRWRMKAQQDSQQPCQCNPEDSANDLPFVMREPSFIEVINNRIYFYSEIERENVLQLTKTIGEMNYNFSIQQKSYQLNEDIKIYLHINSYGGSIFSGLSVVDEILQSELPVYTVVDGCCASSATLISVVGKHRQIKKHSFMLIHQLSSTMWGTFSECEDEMVNQKQLMKTIKEIYHAHTKIPDSKLEEILKHDLWFDATTCKRYGLVDEII